MSNVATSHTIQKFDAKTSKPLDGQRLSKVLYKTPKDGSEKKESVCVSIPYVRNVSEVEMMAMRTHIISMIQNAQDGIIKDRYESGAQFITDADISIAKCIEWMDADSKGERLTKEVVGAWFDAVIGDALTVAIANRIGISDTPSEAEVKKLELHIASYKTKVVGMAGSRTSYPKEVAIKLKNALAVVEPEDDPIYQKMIQKLDKMISEPEIEDLLGL